MGINMKNAEGYHDPTPHEALTNIIKKEKAAGHPDTYPSCPVDQTKQQPEDK